MKNIIFLNLFIWTAILNFLAADGSLIDEDNGELCFVTLVYRHGDRAPVAPYPTDPYKNPTCWPNGWAQLTKLGKLQHLELGRWLRNRYWNFISNRYNVSDIYVRSTDVDRTLMSAYCCLAGLYECWSQGETDFLPWQPIPVHTIPVHMDSVLAGYKNCQVYNDLFQELLETSEVSAFNDCYRDVYSSLSEKSGLSIKSAKDCVFLYSTLNIENMHGFQLPSWTRDFFPEPLKKISEFAFRLPCYTTPLKRFKCGPLLKDIIQHMEDKIGGNLTEKIWMYSAHDTTLANLMQCLDVYDGVIPPYTATVIFELLRAHVEYYVMISYKTPTTFRILRIPDCERICPFESFKLIINSVLPADWEKECQQS
ncbi:hypothetical protein RUM43_003775 [Polyplax serrata]|uniref:acid phosphatase n=1 Tax=Polyplax serrata TaxID=468196 RepID=A0AAN8NVZ6_POLSC